MSADLRGRSLLSLDDLSDAEIDHLLAVASAPFRGAPLQGVSVALVFLNPSLRTRLAGETAMADLGGHAAVLSPGNDAWKWETRTGAVMDGDTVEHLRDAVGTISSMVRGLGLRSFAGMKSWEEDRAETLLKSVVAASACPVYNLESAQDHPLQSLADLMAMRGALGPDLRGKTFTLAWAPHPKPLPLAVPFAALRAADRAGMKIRISCPEGYDLDAPFLRQKPEIVHDRAVKADALYCKSWVAPSLYGRPEEERALRSRYRDWTVDPARLGNARFMHCLPMRRNVEATDEVVDGPGSLVRAQARNRLLVQKAVFLETLRP